MYQTNEQCELTIASHGSPLRAKEATASYEEDVLDFEPCADPEAWLSRRVNYVEYARDEILETPPVAREDMFEMSRWNSVFGMNPSASITQKNPIRIEMPAKDWSWCADPL